MLLALPKIERCEPTHTHLVSDPSYILMMGGGLWGGFNLDLKNTRGRHFPTPEKKVEKKEEM